MTLAKPARPGSKLKNKKPPRPLKQYTFGEEVFNSVTHGVGALMAVVGGSVVVTLAVLFGGPLEVAACAIYAVSLFLLYTMSTLYHAFPFPRAKYVFRIFDHSSVFLLIAGTYTPFMLITLQGSMKGLAIFVIVWAAAILGITLNAISVNRFARLSLFLYIAMGWSLIFAITDVVNNLPVAGVLLLMLGGAGYTIGVIFYVVKRVRYFHSVWHLFVLAGSTMHYLCIVFYVLPKE